MMGCTSSSPLVPNHGGTTNGMNLSPPSYDVHPQGSENNNGFLNTAKSTWAGIENNVEDTIGQVTENVKQNFTTKFHESDKEAEKSFTKIKPVILAEQITVRPKAPGSKDLEWTNTVIIGFTKAEDKIEDAVSSLRNDIAGVISGRKEELDEFEDQMKSEASDLDGEARDMIDTYSNTAESISSPFIEKLKMEDKPPEDLMPEARTEEFGAGSTDKAERDWMEEANSVMEDYESSDPPRTSRYEENSSEESRQNPF